MPTISPEGPAHPNEKCASCGGTATRLTYTPHTGVMAAGGTYLCYDGSLCALIKEYERLLKRTRSA